MVSTTKSSIPRIVSAMPDVIKKFAKHTAVKKLPGCDWRKKIKENNWCEMWGKKQFKHWTEVCSKTIWTNGFNLCIYSTPSLQAGHDTRSVSLLVWLPKMKW